MVKGCTWNHLEQPAARDIAPPSCESCARWLQVVLAINNSGRVALQSTSFSTDRSPPHADLRGVQCKIDMSSFNVRILTGRVFVHILAPTKRMRPYVCVCAQKRVRMLLHVPIGARLVRGVLDHERVC